MTPLTPEQARQMLAQGAVLVDVRSADERARERIDGAVHHPLGTVDALPVGDAPVIFHCRSGMRTSAHSGALAEQAQGRDCYMLAGGIDAWRKAGLATERTAGAPLEIMRQVQIAAGALILIGALLGWLVAPAYFALSAFVGAGLLQAGITGWCGMARLLAAMPWNRTTRPA